MPAPTPPTSMILLSFLFLSVSLILPFQGEGRRKIKSGGKEADRDVTPPHLKREAAPLIDPMDGLAMSPA